jgi:eukaryotic-like serine/threonine-protein kinase
MSPARDSDTRFTIESLLGAGSSAWVYRVRERGSGARYALKVLREVTDNSPARLAEEGRLQAALRHPNLVAVHELVDFEGAPGLLMELVEGGSLGTRLRQGPVGLDEAETLFRGALDGVEAAHAAGLVHRDLKPDNILLDPVVGGGAPRPKVSDFGTARVQAADEGRTLTGMVIGTPAYMAPEQARAPRDVDARADLFSLGVLLYELCTGQRPFAGHGPRATRLAIDAGRYLDPVVLVPDLPARLAQAIRGCLCHDRGERIPDAHHLRQVLDARLSWSCSPAGAAGPGPVCYGAADADSPTLDHAPLDGVG